MGRETNLKAIIGGSSIRILSFLLFQKSSRPSLLLRGPIGKIFFSCKRGWVFLRFLPFWPSQQWHPEDFPFGQPAPTPWPALLLECGRLQSERLLPDPVFSLPTLPV